MQLKIRENILSYNSRESWEKYLLCFIKCSKSKKNSFHSRRPGNKETKHAYNTSLCQALHLYMINKATWKDKGIN